MAGHIRKKKRKENAFQMVKASTRGMVWIVEGMARSMGFVHSKKQAIIEKEIKQKPNHPHTFIHTFLAAQQERERS